MNSGELLAAASALEARAQRARNPAAALQLRGEALVCRGHAWIEDSGEPVDWARFAQIVRPA